MGTSLFGSSRVPQEPGRAMAEQRGAGRPGPGGDAAR